MADTTAADETDSQISFTIKSSADQKYTLSLPASTTVIDLKQKLSTSEYANIPPERQRLIYSGRVLKDPDTLSACKVKDNTTIHLVKGAESNTRQAPANQGGSTPAGAGNVSNVPTNIASGPGANNPLAQLTGARYAGMHGLPNMNMFGADGGMGAPPNPDQMLRLLDDPNFASQMNEAMNNPAVLDMLRNNPMIRNNPMAQAAINNPELRRMMMNPQMLRMQMQMQRAMEGAGGGTANFPMPGQTDTTPSTDTAAGTNNPASTQPSTGIPRVQSPANPLPSTGADFASNPFGALFGAGQATGNDPLAQAAQTAMQDPNYMNEMMRRMYGGGADPFGAFGSPEPQAPADTRPPEEQYANQLRQLNDMGFFDFDRNVQALRRSGGNVQGAIEHLLTQ